MNTSIRNITIPGLMAFDFEINSANKSIPPGLICSRIMKPIPIPIVIPPRIALINIGRCNNPFSGVSQSIIVEVKTNPRIALMK